MDTFHRFKLPLYEQVRYQIQSFLKEKKWQINQPLPSELELANQYQVSIGTIRKAVDKLVDEGVLVKYQGKGTFLKQPDFQNSLLRFFRFRDNSLEPQVPNGIVKSLNVIEAIPAINQKLQINLDAALIYIERIRVIDDIVILSEKIWLPRDIFKLLEKVAIKDFGNLLYPFYYEKCGQFVSSATERLEFIKNYTDVNLNNQIDENLVKVCRIANDLQGSPIEYRESIGRAENFVYEIQIY